MGTSAALSPPATASPAPLVGALVRPLPQSLSPLRALAAVEREPQTVFLESAGEPGEDARWTILAFAPAYRLEIAGNALWRIAGGTKVSLPGPPLEALARAWPPRVEVDFAGGFGETGGRGAPDGRPASVPFASGLAGYLSYDLKDWIERYPARAARESSLPDLSLGFYDVVWIWERSSGSGWVVSTGMAEPDSSSRGARARERMEEQWARVMSRAAPPMRPPAAASERPTRRAVSNFTREGYRRVVERALEHIAAGDIYQVNLAQRFRVAPAPDPAALYRVLREKSPAPFAAFLTFPGGAIVSSSPERFFRIEGDRIETWPIKGTRPRGATPDEDAFHVEALRASEKDRAENVMIVDLERNDLGRICAIGSVKVAALCEVASYANVHHLVSRVEGRLREGTGPVDVIRAMCPGGSITGAPKIRAVEIIDALEPTRRGVYTGAIGYWDVRGSCDFNIAIRTIVVESGEASVHVGGGIVADSTPDGEYEETLVKAGGMLRALDASPEG